MQTLPGNANTGQEEQRDSSSHECVSVGVHVCSNTGSPAPCLLFPSPPVSHQIIHSLVPPSCTLCFLSSPGLYRTSHVLLLDWPLHVGGHSLTGPSPCGVMIIKLKYPGTYQCITSLSTPQTHSYFRGYAGESVIWYRARTEGGRQVRKWNRRRGRRRRGEKVN